MNYGALSSLGVGILMAATACSVASEAPDARESETLAKSQQASHAPVIIRLGALVDSGGPSTSPHFKQAVELAAEQMNAALKDKDVRFEWFYGDTKSTPALARSEAIRLINDEDVLGLVLDSSGDTIAAGRLNHETPAVTERQVPITCFQCSSAFINNPNASDPDPVTQATLRDLENYLWRVFFRADFEAAVMVRVAMQQPNDGDGNADGLFKLAIYNDPSHRSSAFAARDIQPILHPGPSSSEIIEFASNATIPTDLPRVVDNLNENTGVIDGFPDTVLVAGLPNSVTAVVNAYRAAGYTLPIQSVNAFRRDYILAALGAAAEGMEGTSIRAWDDSPSGAAYASTFEAQFGMRPEVTSSGAYDSAATLMLAALVAAEQVGAKNVTADDIRQGLAQINQPDGRVIEPSVHSFKDATHRIKQGRPINYQGAFDPIDWDAAGDMYPPIVHWRVQGGQFVELEAYDCSPATPLCPVVP